MCYPPCFHSLECAIKQIHQNITYVCPITWCYVSHLVLESLDWSSLNLTALNSASIATCARYPYLKYINNPTIPDNLYYSAYCTIWTTVEIGTGATAGSLATLRPLLKKFKPSGSRGLTTNGDRVRLNQSTNLTEKTSRTLSIRNFSKKDEEAACRDTSQNQITRQTDIHITSSPNDEPQSRPEPSGLPFDGINGIPIHGSPNNSEPPPLHDINWL